MLSKPTKQTNPIFNAITYHKIHVHIIPLDSYKRTPYHRYCNQWKLPQRSRDEQLSSLTWPEHIQTTCVLFLISATEQHGRLSCGLPSSIQGSVLALLLWTWFQLTFVPLPIFCFLPRFAYRGNVSCAIQFCCCYCTVAPVTSPSPCYAR